MAEEKIFVGRKAELEEFKKVLAEPGGQAVLVVGQAGMGKTWLVNKMAEATENHPELKCGWVRYEVTPTDSVDSTMALMMDNAFETAQVIEKSQDATPRRLEQWRAFLNVFGIGDLMLSLRRDSAKNTREQFLERLELISGRMEKNQRAVFIIDPEKYMQKESDQSWAIVVKQLPEKIKFIFAQRPNDALISDNNFRGMSNVFCVPDYRLGPLEQGAVNDLINEREKETKYKSGALHDAMSKYEGHPYAIQAAFNLLAADTKLEELPQDPTNERIAEAQWKKLSGINVKAIKLFKGYAILQVAVPDDVLIAVSRLAGDDIIHLLADNYLGGLVREEGAGRRIYHTILADYILGQIGEGEGEEYHRRAVEVYREKLRKAEREQTKPDALAAMRLAEHVLAAEGEGAFVMAVLNESGKILKNLGLLDAVESSLLRALGFVEKGSAEEAMVLGNLGLIYETRGELDKAEEMHKKSLEIEKKLGRLEGMAAQYGNLGVIYYTRGKLAQAEEMHRKSLEIAK